MSQSTCLHVVQNKCKQFHRAHGEIVCTYDGVVCNDSYRQINTQVISSSD